MTTTYTNAHFDVLSINGRHTVNSSSKDDEGIKRFLNDDERWQKVNKALGSKLDKTVESSWSILPSALETLIVGGTAASTLKKKLGADWAGGEDSVTASVTEPDFNLNR